MIRRPDDVSALYIFCVYVHMALTPFPVHRRPPEPNPLHTPCGCHKWMASVNVFYFCTYFQFNVRPL